MESTNNTTNQTQPDKYTYRDGEIISFDLPVETQVITLPDMDKIIDYRRRVYHHVCIKVLKNATIISGSETFRVQCTEEQAKEIQDLVNSLTEDLDYVVENMVFAFIKNKGLLAPTGSKLTVLEG